MNELYQDDVEVIDSILNLLEEYRKLYDDKHDKYPVIVREKLWLLNLKDRLEPYNIGR